MKCPACGSKLHSIQPGEWCCDNPECPENKGERFNTEWYGVTQKQLNEMYNSPSALKEVHDE